MRRRRLEFEHIYHLPMMGETLVFPHDGESFEDAFDRLKQRLYKWKANGKAYRMKADGIAIRIQRVPVGRNTPLSDWLLMEARDRLLLKARPTPRDRKKAMSTADYLNGRYLKSGLTRTERPKDKWLGHWLVDEDRQGRIIIFCGRDEDGNSFQSSSFIDQGRTIRQLWSGEWL